MAGPRLPRPSQPASGRAPCRCRAAGRSWHCGWCQRPAATAAPARGRRRAKACGWRRGAPRRAGGPALAEFGGARGVGKVAGAPLASSLRLGVAPGRRAAELGDLFGNQPASDLTFCSRALPPPPPPAGAGLPRVSLGFVATPSGLDWAPDAVRRAGLWVGGAAPGGAAGGGVVWYACCTFKPTLTYTTS